MTNEIILTLAVLILTAIMFITEIVRIDIAAMISLLALGWLKLVPIDQLFSGFSSNAVISMMAVMILGRGISKTGAMDGFAKFIIAKAKSSKERLVFMLSLTVGLMSGFIQNIGAASLFLPSMIEISREQKISPSKIIMPIGFCAIIGGTLTMIGSGPLLITNDLLTRQGYEPFFIFAVTPIGLSVLLAVSTMFLIFGNKILPDKTSGNEKEEDFQSTLIDYYKIDRDIKSFIVTEKSNLIGKSIEQANIWNDKSLHVVAISDDEGINYVPWREKIIKSGNILSIMGEKTQIESFADQSNLDEMNEVQSSVSDVGFVEIILPVRSSLVGKTIKDYNLRRNHQLEPIVLVSNNIVIKNDISNLTLNQGDILILYGQLEQINNLRTSKDFIIATPINYTPKDSKNTKKAAFSFLLAITLILFGFSVPLSFATGVIFLVLSKTLHVSEIYDAIEWKVVFLVATLMPLGIAMENSGTANFLANTIFSYAAELPNFFVFLMIAVLAAFFSLFMSNVGAVVVLAPMISSIASLSGIDYRLALLLAGVSTANSFMLPTHQVNALLMGAGGYSTKDYLKSGGITTLVFLIVTVLIFTIIFSN